MVQHASIVDPNIHEPKNISIAAADTAYLANGAGSGSWRKIDSLALKGLAGDGGLVDRKILTDGTNGFRLVRDMAYGGMGIFGNTNSFAMTAAVDATLNTNSDYVVLTGTGAPWLADPVGLLGVTFSVDRLTVQTTGIYRVDLWATITSFPSNTAKISVKYRINGTTMTLRHPIVKSNSVGDNGNLNGFGIGLFNAGDYIQVMVASTVTGGLILSDVSAVMTLIKAT